MQPDDGVEAPQRPSGTLRKLVTGAVGGTVTHFGHRHFRQNVYDAELTPEAINCRGCTSGEGVLFQHCTVCEIRKCGVARGVVNCAHCDDYACEKLEEFFKMVPDCRTTLDGIRSGL